MICKQKLQICSRLPVDKRYRTTIWAVHSFASYSVFLFTLTLANSAFCNSAKLISEGDIIFTPSAIST